MMLSIIIVNWNVKDLLQKCLSSIYQYTPDIKFEVFVIDNHSQDKSVDMVRANFPRVNLIANNTNAGFAKANNQGIKPAKGKYILLLNPDTELKDDAFQKMIKFMEAHPDCGILGPKLLNSDLTLQSSCRQFPDILDQIFIQLKFYNFFPHKIKWTREYFMLDFDHNQTRTVDQVMGAAMMVRQEVFDKIGLLDKKFFCWFEEVDFCQRSQAAGWKTYFFREAEIIHHKGKSFKRIASLKRQINFNHSLYYYFKKHHPMWKLMALWMLQPVNLFLTWLDKVVGLKERVGKRKDL